MKAPKEITDTDRLDWLEKQATPGSPRVNSEGFFVSRQDRGYSEFLGPCGEWYQSFHMRSIFDDRDSAELALARANNPVSHAG